MFSTLDSFFHPPPIPPDRLYDYSISLSSIFGRSIVLVSVGANGDWPTETSEADFHNEGNDSVTGAVVTLPLSKLLNLDPGRSVSDATGKIYLKVVILNDDVLSGESR